MQTIETIVEELRGIEPFTEVPRDQLRWLAENAECSTSEKGEVVFDVGDPVDHMFIILQGSMSLSLRYGGQLKSAGKLERGVSGKLPYSRMKDATGRGQTLETTRFLRLHESRFPEMIRTQHELVEALVHRMLTRVRDFTKTEQLNDKLMALGKLSAGLAHELNNPASAVVRSAQALREHWRAIPEKFKAVTSIRLSDAQIDTVNDILFTKINKGVKLDYSLMERSAREDELLDWLDDHEVEDADLIAETLTEFDWTTDELDTVLEQVGPQFLQPVVAWLEDVQTSEKLAADIQDASKRIADLVRSIKSYTHMDQAADKSPTQIRAGIDNTLTMLGHKLRGKAIETTVEIPADLPPIMAMPGELNQVWTNLIDNAVDAMETGGKLEIQAEREADHAVVCVIDNGKGIAPEHIDNIFEPFFTTKGMNEGTGLGLDIVQRIMRNHDADIAVRSEPGKTMFRLAFPLIK